MRIYFSISLHNAQDSVNFYEYLLLCISDETNETQHDPRPAEATDICSPVVFTAKNKTAWSQMASSSHGTGRRQRQNILKEEPGPTSYAKRNVSGVSSAFLLFIDKFIVDHIVNCTEKEAQSKENDESWKTSREEIYKLFGVMLGRGILAKGQPVEFIWSEEWGNNYFKNTMSRNRYKELLRYIRFDTRSSRSERLQTDKFALISTIWNRFIENCKSCYKPHSDITVDEQLFPTKARYPFTQYIASKPDKFGIKFWLAVDVSSKYLVNGFPYLGKDVQRPANESLSEHIVMKLMQPYLQKGRNVTTDNFFTSLNLAEKLQQKDTSIVGTMNRMRKEIPTEIKTRKENLYNSIILKHDNGATLTVYQGKKNKNVLVLSTVHQDIQISDGRKKTPESIQYYNETKYGVDVLDQMARLYSSKVPCCRWPLQVFYNILDLATINAYVIYKEVLKRDISRRQFILKLIQELRSPSSNSNDTDPEEISNIQPINTTNKKVKRQWCKVNCGSRKKRRLASKCCNKCKNYACGSCIARVETIITCTNCQ